MSTDIMYNEILYNVVKYISKVLGGVCGELRIDSIDSSKASTYVQVPGIRNSIVFKWKTPKHLYAKELTIVVPIFHGRRMRYLKKSICLSSPEKDMNILTGRIQKKIELILDEEGISVGDGGMKISVDKGFLNN